MFSLLSPNIYIPATFLLIVVVFAYFLTKDAKNILAKNRKLLPYYNEILLSLNYINRNICENGRFNYRKNINSSVEYDDNIYNSLRHAGILYAIFQCEQSGYSVITKEDRIRVSKYFIDRYIKSLDKTKNVVISLPEEEQISAMTAKTGACGVSLCSLSHLVKENISDINNLRGIGEFLLSMINDDGVVAPYYDIENKITILDTQDLYYQSEVATGLLYLYETDRQEKWVVAAKKIIDNIITTRKSLELEIPFDSWSLFAIEKLFEMKLVNKEERDKYYSYMNLQTISVLSKQVTNKNNRNFGAFIHNLRPSNVALVIEGLISVYKLSHDEKLKKLIYKSLLIGCAFLDKIQVKTGEQAGGIPNSANWVSENENMNSGVIRMDNIQHVILAWLKFQDIVR